jgi:uracil-DNA glycosylase family 4
MRPDLRNAFPLATAEFAFTKLVLTVRDCRQCPRMEGRTRVLGPANGAVSARILFVGEAPGRFGADASGVPLWGDRTGRTFGDLLAAAGLSRSDIFITNAVLCNPRDEMGRNDRPTRAEVANCQVHLARVIRIINPDWVVTLGATALGAVERMEPHGRVLRCDVGVPVRWFGRWLLPLYHPGPRALIRRPVEVQRADYARLGELLMSSGRQLTASAGKDASGSSTASVSLPVATAFCARQPTPHPIPAAPLAASNSLTARK